MTSISIFVLLLFGAAISFQSVAGQTDAELIDICNTAPLFAPDDQKCSACIRRHPKCAWCSKAGYEDDSNNFRCSIRERLEQSCPQNMIVSPQSKVEVVRNESLSNAGVNERLAVQIKPQEYRMKLRPNDTQEIEIQFRQAVDYPVDLYYLMDLSYSMSDDKNKLTQLGDLLAYRMTQITKNFQLGFGSFVDKKVMPFVDPRPEVARTPCGGCVEPYGFRHHMDLTTDTQRFKRLVSEANVSGNLDAPEGGLDAVVQALACPQRIGWRDRSRKIIVYSSDAGFHYAGDGRLGGLVIPNDGQCHMDTRGYYDKSTEQDYPSIGRVHKILRDSEANMIFAVTAEQKDLYDRLRHALTDISATVGILANDSSNVVDLIVDEYKKISQQIALVSTLKDEDGINLDFSAICKNGAVNMSNACGGVQLGDTITFKINITVVNCENKDKPIKFAINPAGLSENVTITLTKLCDCDCSKPGNPSYVVKSKECNYRGDLACGLCKCPPPYAGRRCECDTSTISGRGKTTAELDLMCRPGNDSNAPLCSGRGVCVCGQCVCNKLLDDRQYIYGKFCECDNYSCPRANGKICGGHGTCGCDQQCKCEEGWTGRDCSCTTNPTTCISPTNLKLCSGKGHCVCGVCNCFDDMFSGATCDVCPTCPSPCVRFRDCVLYKAFNRRPMNQSEFEIRCQHNFIIVKDLPDVWDNRTLPDTCQFVDAEDECTYYFKYAVLEDGNVTLIIREDKDCPPLLPVLAIILGVIAGIVIIGLVLLLLWKLLTIIHDRREFANFEKERLQSKWDTGENPIFHAATTTYQNPVYGGK